MRAAARRVGVGALNGQAKCPAGTAGVQFVSLVAARRRGGGAGHRRRRVHARIGVNRRVVVGRRQVAFVWARAALVLASCF